MSDKSANESEGDGDALVDKMSDQSKAIQMLAQELQTQAAHIAELRVDAAFLCVTVGALARLLARADPANAILMREFLDYSSHAFSEKPSPLATRFVARNAALRAQIDEKPVSNSKADRRELWEVISGGKDRHD